MIYKIFNLKKLKNGWYKLIENIFKLIIIILFIYFIQKIFKFFENFLYNLNKKKINLFIKYNNQMADLK